MYEYLTRIILYHFSSIPDAYNALFPTMDLSSNEFTKWLSLCPTTDETAETISKAWARYSMRKMDILKKAYLSEIFYYYGWHLGKKDIQGLTSAFCEDFLPRVGEERAVADAIHKGIYNLDSSLHGVSLIESTWRHYYHTEERLNKYQLSNLECIFDNNVEAIAKRFPERLQTVGLKDQLSKALSKEPVKNTLINELRKIVQNHITI